MAMTSSELTELIRAALPDAEITIEDLAGDGDHYAARIISGAFRGKTRIQQHRMVFDALEGKAGTDLHALALRTCAPEEKS